MPRLRKPASPFRCFNSSPEVIRLAVLMYVKYPLSLRNVGDLLHERGIDICHETVRFWWNRFGRCCQTNAHKSPFRAFRSLTMAAQAMRLRHSASAAERSIL